MQSYRGQKGVKRLHVNQHNMRANMKDADNRPIFTCKVEPLRPYGRDTWAECACVSRESTWVWSPSMGGDSGTDHGEHRISGWSRNLN